MDFLTVLSAIISASLCIIKTHFKEMIRKHSESKFVKLNQRGGGGDRDATLSLIKFTFSETHTHMAWGGGEKGKCPRCFNYQC